MGHQSDLLGFYWGKCGGQWVIFQQAMLDYHRATQQYVVSYWLFLILVVFWRFPETIDLLQYGQFIAILDLP